MTTEIAEFVGLANVRPLTDATRMAFRIEMRDRAPIELACNVDDVTAIISYLAAGAIHVRRSKHESDSEADSPQAGMTIAADPIPACGAGFAMAGNPDQVYLVIHLAEKLNLAFEIPHNKLAAVAQNLSRTATTLSAANRKA